MSAPVDTRITPAIDPETFRATEGYNEDTRGFVDGVINAFNDAFVTVGKIHDARAAADRNGAWNDEQKILIVGQAADKQRERVLNRIALAERDLRANISHTTSLLMQPLTEQAGLGSLNSEVRAFVRQLDRSEREKFMHEALDTNDEKTLAALLGAQHFLSGLTAVDRDHFLRLYNERRQPQLVQRLDVMQRVLDKLERNGPLVHSAFAKAVGAKPSIVAHLDRMNEQAKAALNIQPTD